MTESNSSVGVFVAGTGSYVPEKVLTNDELAARVDTSDEWIVTRTGIKERRIAAADEFTSDLATKAALKAMERAGVTPEQIDLIIVATITPDYPFPSTAALVRWGRSGRWSSSRSSLLARPRTDSSRATGRRRRGRTS